MALLSQDLQRILSGLGQIYLDDQGIDGDIDVHALLQRCAVHAVFMQLAQKVQFGGQCKLHLQVAIDFDSTVLVSEGFESEKLLTSSRPPTPYPHNRAAETPWRLATGDLHTILKEQAKSSESAVGAPANNCSRNEARFGTWTEYNARPSTTEWIEVRATEFCAVSIFGIRVS